MDTEKLIDHAGSIGPTNLTRRAFDFLGIGPNDVTFADSPAERERKLAAQVEALVARWDVLSGQASEWREQMIRCKEQGCPACQGRIDSDA